jgi:hypothetical protein
MAKCNYCRFFHAVTEPCGVCGALPEIPAIPIAPKRIPAPIAVVPKAPQKTSIKPILAKLTEAGMRTNNQIYEGVRTGKVVQTISWHVGYDRVLDYLETQGFNVAMYRTRIVCGGEAA